jgi:hypothetical protein
MQAQLRKLMLLTFICLFPLTTFAWNALGHMVIADIAYQHLQPSVREKVDKLVASLHEEYTSMTSFQHIAYWPDMIRSQKIETYTHWHYIDVPFSTDGTPLKNTIDTDNAVWALQHIQVVVHNAHANPYERSRFLSFLTHIVGDLHQPLHTVSYLSSAYPNGDQGGNLYYIRYNNKRVNLHKIWDEGVGTFVGDMTPDNMTAVSNAIMTRYPKAYFGERIDNGNADEWAKEGMTNAINYVYSTPENQAPNADYIEKGKQIAEQQAALAGYRLAVILNRLLA